MEAFEHPIKLLLVDDEPDFLESTARALGRRGFEVTTARDGQVAIKLLETVRYEVAVMDVRMPGIQGDDLFRLISQRWPELPVILLTGHGTVSQAFVTSKQGVFDYLTKPCSIELLAGTARQAAGLGESRPRPASEPPIGDAGQTPDADDRELGEIRLLLVDDEPDFLRSLAAGMRRRGIATAIAVSGDLAMDLVAQQHFDVAVIDLRMPGMDGLELLDQLKARQPAMQVVLLTGQPTVASVRKALGSGAFDYLLKPHDNEELVAKVRAAAEKSRLIRGKQREELVEGILEQRSD